MQEQGEYCCHSHGYEREHAEQEPRRHIGIRAGVRSALEAERHADNFIAERDIKSVQAVMTPTRLVSIPSRFTPWRE